MHGLGSCLGPCDKGFLHYHPLCASWLGEMAHRASGKLTTSTYPGNHSRDWIYSRITSCVLWNTKEWSKLMKKCYIWAGLNCNQNFNTGLIVSFSDNSSNKHPSPRGGKKKGWEWLWPVGPHVNYWGRREKGKRSSFCPVFCWQKWLSIFSVCSFISYFHRLCL